MTINRGEEKFRSTGLVVLGMHRSGTSAVMGALQAMGVFVGDRASLTAPNWDNPKGFFERKDARRVCDALLQGAGADWWQIADFRPEEVPQSLLVDQVAEMQKVFAELKAAGFWALKEPRLCLLFPLIAPLVEDAGVLLIVRHPVAVGLSLQKRQGYSLQAGVALWERYNRAAVENSGGRQVFRLVFEDVVARPATELAQLGMELEAWVPGLDIDVEAGIATIDPKSHHHTSNPELERLLTDEQKHLWHCLAAGRTPAPWSAEGRRHNRLQLMDLARVHTALHEQAMRERDAHRATRAAQKELKRLQLRLEHLEAKKSSHENRN